MDIFSSMGNDPVTLLYQFASHDPADAGTGAGDHGCWGWRWRDCCQGKAHSKAGAIARVNAYEKGLVPSIVANHHAAQVLRSRLRTAFNPQATFQGAHPAERTHQSALAELYSLPCAIPCIMPWRCGRRCSGCRTRPSAGRRKDRERRIRHPRARRSTVSPRRR